MGTGGGGGGGGGGSSGGGSSGGESGSSCSQRDESGSGLCDFDEYGPSRPARRAAVAPPSESAMGEREVRHCLSVTFRCLFAAFSLPLLDLLLPFRCLQVQMRVAMLYGNRWAGEDHRAS